MFNIAKVKVLISPPALSSSTSHRLVSQIQNLGVTPDSCPILPTPSSQRNWMSYLLPEHNSKSIHFSSCLLTTCLVHISVICCLEDCNSLLPALPASIPIPIRSADTMNRFIFSKRKPYLVTSHCTKNKIHSSDHGLWGLYSSALSGGPQGVSPNFISYHCSLIRHIVSTVSFSSFLAYARLIPASEIWLFYWSIIDLQYCINFCCTAKWFFFTLFSIIVYHGILNMVPCAIQ